MMKQHKLFRLTQDFTDQIIAMYDLNMDGPLSELVIVVREIDQSILMRLKQSTKKLSKHIGEFKLMSQEELKSGIDVFPIEFLALKERGVLVYGEDILKEIKVSDKNLRQACEFYLRSRLMTMREMFVMQDRTPVRIIQDSLPGIVEVFRDVLRLGKGENGPLSTEEIIQKMHDIFGLDKEVFHQLLNPKQSSVYLKKLFFDYVEEIQGVIKKIDQLPYE